MTQFIADLLPMLPWEGPPLPRFLGILWPWNRAEGQLPNLPRLPALREFISSIEESSPQPQAPAVTYQNIEEIDFPEGFDPETFMPRKIRIKRKTETR